MGISIRTNSAANRAALNLNRASDALGEIHSRLSSGLRIQKASDDAAGYALSKREESDAKVYGQATKNASLGVTYLRTAQEAVDVLSDLTSTMNELAKRSQSTAITGAQRTAIQDEFESLRTEYNRIVSDTEFNYSDIFTSSNTSVSVSVGYTSTSLISASLTGGVTETVGAGTFNGSVSYAGGTDVNGILLEDFNRDGALDMVTSSVADGKVYINLGNGDGTFKARISAASFTATTREGLSSGDFNGDGKIDLVAWGDKPNVYLSNGDGTFLAPLTFVAGGVAGFGDVGDFNGDDKLDLIASDGSKGYVLLGNGDGTFKARISFTIPSLSENQIQVADLNGDGILDAVTNASFNAAYVALGNGDGTFRVAVSYNGYSALSLSHIALGDLNNDGYLDITQANAGAGSTVSVMLGNGDGTFRAFTSFNGFGAMTDPHLADLNLDGNLDYISSSTSGNFGYVALGRGDGTFGTATAFTGGASPSLGAVGDLNGDHIPDFVAGGNGSGSAYVVTERTTTATNTWRVRKIYGLTVASASEAAFAENETTRIAGQLASITGSLNAGTSRFESAGNVSQSFAIASNDAYQKITEVDVAVEAEALIRKQLQQQSASVAFEFANKQFSSLAGQLLDKLA